MGVSRGWSTLSKHATIVYLIPCTAMRSDWMPQNRSPSLPLIPWVNHPPDGHSACLELTLFTSLVNHRASFLQFPMGRPFHVKYLSAHLTVTGHSAEIDVLRRGSSGQNDNEGMSECIDRSGKSHWNGPSQPRLCPTPAGSFSITITVDTYTHWIEKAERGDVLEVDRLSQVPSSEAVTLTGATA